MGYGKRISVPTLVQIDLDYRTAGKNRDVGSASSAIPARSSPRCCRRRPAASTKASAGSAAQWMSELTQGRGCRDGKAHAAVQIGQPPIHPYRVAWEINEFLTDDTIYIGDGGDVVTISAQAVRPRRPGHWMDPGALGRLGIGTGFALAAKLAHPQKEVLCYYGDGSFGMTAFDMETANRFGAPYIAVIGNNSAMNQIRYGQLAKYGEQRGNIGNLLGDVRSRQVRADAGRLWRGGARCRRRSRRPCAARAKRSPRAANRR